MRSPVAIDFDEDGRLYVAEFPEYNDYADPRPHGVGCIRLLESTRRDGVYDRSTLFAPDVPRAVAVGCWDGGIYVGSAPGGPYDAYARLVARHLGKHLPGSPNVVVQNMPGASGRRLMGFIYSRFPRTQKVLE